MKKRLTSLLLALLILIAPSAMASESLLPEPGFWMDSWSQRASLELTRSGDEYTARIHWAGSAFEFYQWEMTGQFSDGVLTVDNCKKTHHSYLEDGAELVSNLYDSGKASLTYSNGIITWQDETEGMGAECRFELYSLDGAPDVKPEPYTPPTLFGILMTIAEWMLTHATPAV